ncbi:Mucin-desulfating sulfatase (N-acetylglucosamine-6-sulfatase) [Planctomycetales bacterium 10988]|nr:Mucin-desulfating sulfatase (N-acetylglucosamine-6-sulfatase) [Planctomycetales bacterium 10988]
MTLKVWKKFSLTSAAWQAICLAVLGSCYLLAPSTSLAQKETKRPNILFIFTDDHANHSISAYGSKINKTPNLDRIANEGMRFDRCYVTNSICGPCRAVILTGKYSHLNGFVRNGNTFNGEQQTVSKLLQKAGYQTAVIGKWHLKSDPTGFDHYEVLIGQGPYYNCPLKTPEGVVQHTGYTTNIITDQTLRWLKEDRKEDQPFFLMYQHKAPHRNWMPGPEYLNMYDDVTIPEPDDLFDDYEGRGSAAKQQEMTIAEHMNGNDLKLTEPRGLTPEQLKVWNEAYEPKNKAFREANLQGKDLVRWKYQRYIKDYLRCVAAVDDNVGRVLQYLDDSGLSENTIVIYSSDQGFYLGDHGWFDKRWMYEESLLTPLLVKWPGVTKPGSVNNDMVSNLDFAETFLEVADASIPSDMQGKSLVPILKGNTPKDWRKSFYYRYYEYPGAHSVRQHYGVRTDRYKLMYFPNLDEWELYDLEKDPGEMKSVYGDPEYKKITERLKKELDRLQKKYKDDGSVVTFKADPAKVKPEVLVNFTFDGNQNPRLVVDQSEKKHRLRLGKATLEDGRSNQAVRLNGMELSPLNSNKRVEVANCPFAVGAWCLPESGSGVIASQGGGSQGYCLYLEEGVPVFTVRVSGSTFEVRGDVTLPLNAWAHVVGAVNAKGRMTIYVAGKPLAKAKAFVLSSQPADGLTIGADSGSKVLVDQSIPTFQGLIDDFQLHVGPLDREVLQAWATE